MIDFGMDREAFRSDFFERGPLLRRGCFDASRFGWSLIDRALDIQDPSRESLKVMHGGRLDPSNYVEEYSDVGLRRRRILKDRLYRLVDEGATVVLNRIELVSLPVRDICMEIGRFIGAQATANAYASLGKEPATSVHWDTHDVFVVQLGGRKRWRLYEPTHPLPISSQESHDHKEEVPKEPILDEVLEAGDTLYVPRGWWHRVEPVEGSDTLHLAVGIHTPLILDYLVWACASVLPNFLEMRRSLLGRPGETIQVDEAISILASTMRDPKTLAAFYERSEQRERVITPFHFNHLVHKSFPIPEDTYIMLNTRYASRDSTVIRINGSVPNTSGVHQTIIGVLAGSIDFSIIDLRSRLPGISVDEIDTALRDLARADLIALSLPSEHYGVLENAA